MRYHVPQAVVALVAVLLVTSNANGDGVTRLSGTTWITLGTKGGPLPSATRAQSSNVLVVAGRPYVVDAGTGVIRQLAAVGISPVQIRQVFITHHHDDHNAELGALIGTAWTLSSKNPITVFGPRRTTDVLRGFAESFAPSAETRRADFPGLYKVAPRDFFTAVNIGEANAARVVYKDDLVEVSALTNCHYHFEQPLADSDSYAYRFKTADKVIVFSGDTGPCEQLVDFASGADVLVHEVVNLKLLNDASRGNFSDADIQIRQRHMEQDHSTPEDVGRLAARAHVGRVVLTHLIPGGDAVPDSAYSDGVSRFFPGPVTVAKDLMRF